MLRVCMTSSSRRDTVHQIQLLITVIMCINFIDVVYSGYGDACIACEYILYYGSYMSIRSFIHYVEIEGFQVRASPEALSCVHEQDTLSSV